MHYPKHEFEGSKLRTYPEQPARIERILNTIKTAGYDELYENPQSHEFSIIERVHDHDYLDFLKLSTEFLKQNEIDEICPTIFSKFLPTHFETSFFAKLGYYIFDPATPLTVGTYQAAIDAVNTSISTVKGLDFSNQNFALCRPPGHHASANGGGGYCILNNMAISAQYLRDKGKSVSILDLDYHHGNGTQEIFYRTDSVQYVSLHADPTIAYPFYWGSQKETGIDDGKGYNHNFPLHPLCDEKQYLEKLDLALSTINEYSPDVLLISMGFDCHIDDPIAGMKLSTGFYKTIGERLSKYDRLAVLLEGGYGLDVLGPAFMNLLEGIKSD